MSEAGETGMVTLIDYGMGNIASVANMIRYCGGTSVTTAEAGAVAGAAKLVLPGVGSFDAGMAALRASGLDAAIRSAVRERGAILLGICLGMQLLLEGSEEGEASGLGLVPGRVRRFDGTRSGLRVPHMGWTDVRPVRDSMLFVATDESPRFYFVHSYYAECAEEQDVTAVSEYGERFVSALERGRVLGVQFHPEKSHRYGMGLFRRFLSCS